MRFVDAATGEEITDKTVFVQLVNPKRKDLIWRRIKSTFAHTAGLFVQLVNPKRKDLIWRRIKSTFAHTAGLFVQLVNPKRKDPIWRRIKSTFAHTAGLKTGDIYVPEHDLTSDATHDWNGINLKWSIA